MSTDYIQLNGIIGQLLGNDKICVTKQQMDIKTKYDWRGTVAGYNPINN